MSNKKNFSPKKSAFSLIELSIVLIIIGLLIAGITGGASLVSSSTLRAVMGEARGYSVGVNSFYAQFNGLPGDYNTSVLPTSGILSGTYTNTSANGNGIIEYNTAPGEGTGAIYNLVGTKIIDPTSLFPSSATQGMMTFVTSVSTALTVGTHIPTSKSKGAGWVFDNVPTTAYSGTTGQNVVVLTNGSAAGAALPLVAASGAGNGTVNNAIASLVPADLLSIDTKLDDGKVTTGRVTGTALTGCMATNAPTVATTAYAVATTTKACVLSYQIDPNI
jgi:prepilin-type N-terminal cleavage/methylation domain-containing protein